MSAYLMQWGSISYIHVPRALHMLNRLFILISAGYILSGFSTGKSYILWVFTDVISAKQLDFVSKNPVLMVTGLLKCHFVFIVTSSSLRGR